MAKSLRKLLSEPNDFKLCNGLFLRIYEHHGQETIDVSEISAEERVVFLVWHASGIIDNGGFRYLFEGDFKGDPDFALTAEAFRATGCKEAAEAVLQTLAMFPNSRPPNDIGERLRYYLKRVKRWPTDLDSRFWDTQDDLRKSLGDYIRSHADAFRHLEKPQKKRPPRSRSERVEEAPETAWEVPALADLPRWAQVAFAAHCARKALPFLTQNWPGVPIERSNSVREAIDLADQSAAQGRPVQGLKDAILNAVMAAGAAMLSNPELGPAESPPDNAYSGTIASFVAKAAEKAAESAHALGDDAVIAATEAWSYATSAAGNGENFMKELEEDFVRIHRAPIRGKWTDRTKIPNNIWMVC